jgi:hypothetical protein
VAVVGDWAWPIITEHVRRMLPSAALFPAEWKCYHVVHWYRWIVVEKLELSRRIKVHAARHHWAVMHLRAGVMRFSLVCPSHISEVVGQEAGLAVEAAVGTR